MSDDVQARIDGAARKLLDDRAAGRKLLQLPDALRPRDLDEAYRVQEELLDLCGKAGDGPLVGWKIALTTPQMREMVGVNQPCAGAILARRARLSPAKVRRADYVKLGVETEIALRLHRPLPPEGAPHDRDKVAAAVGAVMAATETVDDQDVEYKTFDAALLIACNSFNMGCVLGPPVEDWRALDLAALAGRMAINGETVGQGMGADAMGHPLDALTWLVNHLAERGIGLVAGQFVLTGSMVTTRWLEAGDEMVSSVDKLGEARLTVV